MIINYNNMKKFNFEEFVNYSYSYKKSFYKEAMKDNTITFKDFEKIAEHVQRLDELIEKGFCPDCKTELDVKYYESNYWGNSESVAEYVCPNCG